MSPFSRRSAFGGRSAPPRGASSQGAFSAAIPSCRRDFVHPTPDRTQRAILPTVSAKSACRTPPACVSGCPPGFGAQRSSRAGPRRRSLIGQRPASPPGSKYVYRPAIRVAVAGIPPSLPITLSMFSVLCSCLAFLSGGTAPRRPIQCPSWPGWNRALHSPFTKPLRRAPGPAPESGLLWDS